MPGLDLRDLMLVYAKRGVAHWKGASADIKKRAGECLANRIADNVDLAARTLKMPFTRSNASNLLFIPMLKHPSNRRFEWCFFVPMWEGEENPTISFDLFFLVRKKDCLGFRFEPADAAGAHDYGHVQMNRQMLGETLAVPTLPWIPYSYPAFPTTTSDPLRMFLYMATTVHGHSSGVLDVLLEIFRAEGRPGDAVSYAAELKKVLGLVV
jgi:hypothetical protein